MKKLLLSITLLLAFSSIQAQSNITDKDDPKQKGLSSINEDAIRGPLEFLASPWTEGRETGSRGSFMAADYLVSMLKVYGITPLGQYQSVPVKQYPTAPTTIRTYFQDFSLSETSPGEVQKMRLTFTDGQGTRDVDLNYRSDFFCGMPEAGFDLSATVVFVGYANSEDPKSLNELKSLDLKGKIIFRMQGVPELKFLSDDYFQKRGAIALITVASDVEVQNWADNYPVHFKSDVYEGNTIPESLRKYRMRIPVDTLNTALKRVLITKRFANEILRGAGITVDSYANYVAGSKSQPLKTLTGVNASIAMSVKSRIIKARNILGMIEGENPNEYVVMGGHYDHLGMQNGFIYNGADDNGSGTVGILTLARAFKASGVKPKRTIIFALWTGEEKGLLGSNYFVNNSLFKDKKIAFYLNWDMISRSAPEDTAEKAVRIIYTKAYPAFEQITNKNLKALGSDLKPLYVPMEQPRGGSDFTAFSLKNIPLMTWNAGHPLDYHQLSDEVSKVNWPRMLNIIKLGFLDVWEIVNGNVLK